MTTTISVELEVLPRQSRTFDSPRPEGRFEAEVDANNSVGTDPVAQYLAPADGGLAAWKVLLGAFTFEAILWGM